MKDAIVMKKDDNRSLKFLKVSCNTKFRFVECEVQCILGECGPLVGLKLNGYFVFSLGQLQLVYRPLRVSFLLLKKESHPLLWNQPVLRRLWKLTVILVRINHIFSNNNL